MRTASSVLDTETIGATGPKISFRVSVTVLDVACATVGATKAPVAGASCAGSRRPLVGGLIEQGQDLVPLGVGDHGAEVGGLLDPGPIRSPAKAPCSPAENGSTSDSYAVQAEPPLRIFAIIAPAIAASDIGSQYQEGVHCRRVPCWRAGPARRSA